jgi:hypothetical protein
MHLSNLDAAFTALAPFFQIPPEQPPKLELSARRLKNAFERLKDPLEAAKRKGGLINPWTIAGLKRSEIRNTAVLRGLWLSDFGGDLSRRFLQEFLAFALPDVPWAEELSHGYSVNAECNPLGDLSDRVDLVIMTKNQLLGIEVKIDARLGPEQLERYIAAITLRAKMNQLTPNVIFLAPFASQTANVVSTTWHDITAAADRAAKLSTPEPSHTAYLISAFGEHVSNF